MAHCFYVVAATVKVGIFIVNAVLAAHYRYIIFIGPILYYCELIIYRLLVAIARILVVMTFARSIFCFWIKRREKFSPFVRKRHPSCRHLVAYPFCSLVGKEKRF